MTERKATLNLVVSLMLALLLAACGRNTPPTTDPPTNNPPTPTTPAPREISGTADGWTGGEAVVRAENYGSAHSRDTFVSEGTINADGSFSLTLPVEGAELAAALFTVDEAYFCPDQEDSVSTIEITPGPFEITFTANYFLVFDSTGSEVLGSIFPAELTEENSFIYAYASSDATVKGDCVTTYGDGSSTYRVDHDFKPGWNAIFSTESGSVLSSSTGPFPVDTNTRWTYMSEVPPPSPLIRPLLHASLTTPSAHRQLD